MIDSSHPQILESTKNSLGQLLDDAAKKLIVTG